MNLFKLMLCFGLVCLGAEEAFALGREQVPIIERPVEYVWDRDDLFRGHPEKLREVMECLRSLEEDTGMEVYVVTYSSGIREGGKSFADRCHDKWLGLESDGLVIVLGFNDLVTGNVGRSQKLYNGHFIERGLMPRVSYVRLEGIIGDSIKALAGEQNKVKWCHDFVESVSGKLKEHFLVKAEVEKSNEGSRFFVWIMLLLVLCAGVFVVFCRTLGSVEKRIKRTYQFPDFRIERRLNGRCGGGKISVVEFEIPPFSDVL